MFKGRGESVSINYLTLNKGYCIVMKVIMHSLKDICSLGKGKINQTLNNVRPFQASGTLALVGAKLTASSISEYG